ncbi:MAG: nucleoside-diphosphate kinase, partial [Thermoplasmata archaeon]|nr:nucleoside-diphosphate kinase [Thermoplasmata archaeon]
MERTFVMIKPDGVQRCLVGQVIQKFERKGFKLIGLKLMTISPELAAEHYGEHVGKPFYDKLMTYITSGPVAAMVVEGKEAVSAVRTMVGKTNPLEAAPGTIRGDLGLETGRNLIHASDSLPSAEREISLFFN